MGISLFDSLPMLRVFAEGVKDFTAQDIVNSQRKKSDECNGEEIPTFCWLAETNQWHQ